MESSGRSKLQDRTNARGVRILVVGVGGGGGNAVDRMLDAGLGGVEMIAANTDVVALNECRAASKIVLGGELTRGRGAGGDVEVGRKAAEEARHEIRRILQHADMVFLAAGLGGGTGTGAAPVIADIAAEYGALTVAVVTKPFSFEGRRRLEVAEWGINELKSRLDTVIVVPNDRMLKLNAATTRCVDAFRLADDVLRQGVQGISDIITVAGCINVDFADVRATLARAGTAVMGIGEAEGEDRATSAVQRAVFSPLLETPIDGALRVLVNVTSGLDFTLMEAQQAVSMITARCHREEAHITWGWVPDGSMGDRVRITVLAAGFEGQTPSPAAAAETSVPRQVPAPDRPPEPAVRQAPRPVPVQRETPPVSVQTLLASQTEGEVEATAEENEENLETPAFWRRR